MIYRFGECELDTRLGELRVAGSAIHVEPQVFSLLWFLLVNHDRMVTREELLDSVWGHRFVAAATLSSRLKALRRAIGDDGKEQRFVRTVRGRGFRFIAPVSVGQSEEPGGVEGTTTEDRDGPHLAEAERGAGGQRLNLVAREEELRQLDGLLDEVRGGVRRVVLLTGESGIGKSALAEAYLAGLPAGVRLARGQCVEQTGAGEPYLPLLDALGRLARGRDGADVVRCLSAYAPTWLVQMPSLLDAQKLEEAQRRSLGATRERMLREVVEALELLGRDAPLVLLLEDLHWSDPSTLELIVWLAQRPEPARVLILGTLRSGEAGKLVRAAIERLRRTERFTELQLTGWTEWDVESYCTRAYPDRLFPPEVVHLTHLRSGGNPLFARTLLADWITRGILPAEGGGSLDTKTLQALEDSVPDTLRMLLETQVDRLTDAEQRILEAGSVAGADFSARLVAAMLQIDEEDADACCTTLSRQAHMIGFAGIADLPDGGWSARYEFVHHLFRDILYSRIPPSARAGLHLRAAEYLEGAAGGREPEEVTALARHFSLGRDEPRAVRYLILSAEQALSRGAHVEAIAYLEDGLDRLARKRDIPNALSMELSIQRMLGSALLVTRGWGDSDAERAFDRAKEISEALSDREELAHVLYGMAYLHELRGNFQRSEAILRQRLELGRSPSDGAVDLEAHELLSCSLFHQGRFARALENASAAIAAFDPLHIEPFTASLGDNAGIASYYWSGLTLWFVGRPEQALEPIGTATRLAEKSQLVYMRAAARAQAARLHHFRGEPDLVLTNATIALQTAQRQGYPYHEAVSLTLRGWARVRKGEIDAGVEEIRLGLQMQEAAGADMERPYGLGLLAEALLFAGRTAEGITATQEALEIIARRTRTFFWQAELYRLEGELRHRLGEVDEALELLHRSRGIADSQGAVSLQLRTALSLARLAPSPDVRRQALVLLAGIFQNFDQGFDTADLRHARELLAFAHPA